MFASIAVGVIGYGRLSYKHYLLEQFAKELDPLEKDIISGKYPFSSGELKGADSYLRKYGKTHRKWILFPLVYLSAEAIKVWKQKRKR